MNTENKSHDIVRACAQCHGIADLTLSEAGTAGLRLQDGVELYLERVADQGKLFLYTFVGTLPHEPEERLAYLEHLLHLHCLEQGTRCGTLAVDGLTDAVLLQTALAEAELSMARLEQAAQDLLLHRPRLIEELRRFEGKGATPKRTTVQQMKRRLATGGVQ